MKHGIVLIVFGCTALLHLAVVQSQFGPSVDFYYSLLFSPQSISGSFEWTTFVDATLPRLVMANAVGAMFGLVGSLFQQLTQNRLMSPLTLGTSAGAWLGLVILSVLFPSLSSLWQSTFALSGALLAMMLVISIVGFRNLTGLPVILAGMAVNLLLGAFATAIILLNQQYADNLFIWGTGDLGQNGWELVKWLLPKLAISVAIVFFAPRILQVLSLGSRGAEGRGLNTGVAFVILSFIGVWLVSVSITAVGLISFVGLIAPNIARSLGYTRARQELLAATVLGAAILLLTDSLAVFISQWSLDLIPTGTATAIIGAPMLIVIARRKFDAQDVLSLTLPKGRLQLNDKTYFGVAIAAILIVAVTLFVPVGDVHTLRIPDRFEWDILWPRLLAGIASGAGLAVAGVILQRLVYNPLASPDILGVSSGAVFALVLTSLITGVSIHETSFFVAIAGAVATLVGLLILGRKHQFSPSMLVLTGVALTATLEALVQFSLTRVGSDKYTILSWLSGSTYRVSRQEALIAISVVIACIFLSLRLSRWLTLLATGHQFARARGLPISISYVMLLALVAVFCATVTTTMGPVAFVGLLAPHIATLLGARHVKVQLILAPMVGAVLLCVSDLIGQWIVFPAQIAAGTIVSVIGGSYFIFLLTRSRSS
ncbi:Fe(3+)-hydroxamate ABC transporter permease FhuB [Vibrio sp. MA40-2]|uniref:Fe(3+)-hydroxamate ABC transporter permease FhuB n=1 Tax=Vibrio sp. MA40-2 TaxID=3391828 RepID=UPI0039A750C0